MASSSPTNPLLSSIFSNPSSLKTQTPLLKLTNHQSLLFKTRTHFSITPPTSKLIRALEREQSTATSLLRQEQLGVAENVKVLKNAAKTRQVAASEIISALIAIEKAKVDSSEFLNTLGGSETPGRTWMLIFTAKERMESGSYFPITAVQRFDAAASMDLFDEEVEVLMMIGGGMVMLGACIYYIMLRRRRIHTSTLSRHVFTKETQEGHPQIAYDLFRM